MFIIILLADQNTPRYEVVILNTDQFFSLLKQNKKSLLQTGSSRSRCYNYIDINKLIYCNTQAIHINIIN